MYENAHGATTRALQRARAVEMHFGDFESPECAVNSSELAGHGRALQRSKHQLPFPYTVRIPSVSTLLGERHMKELYALCC